MNYNKLNKGDKFKLVSEDSTVEGIVTYHKHDEIFVTFTNEDAKERIFTKAEKPGYAIKELKSGKHYFLDKIEVKI